MGSVRGSRGWRTGDADQQGMPPDGGPRSEGPTAEKRKTEGELEFDVQVLAEALDFRYDLDPSAPQYSQGPSQELEEASRACEAAVQGPSRKELGSPSPASLGNCSPD